MSQPADGMFALPLFHKCYAFIKALTNWQIQCKKEYRYTISVTVVRLSHTIFELLVRANTARGFKRTNILFEASAQLDLLKIFIRLAKDTGAMTDKQYIYLQGLVIEVGKLLGTWIKLPTKESA